jgi:hypothetical protein
LRDVVGTDTEIAVVLETDTDEVGNGVLSFLASFSVWDSWSLTDSAAFALKSAKVSKIGTKKLATGVTQAAFVGVFS